MVREVDLQVPRGVAFGYLGPNGAGKTTLIRMLLGLTRAERAGRCACAACPCPQQRAEALSRVGAIVEEPRFHGHLTGRENLGIVAAARGRETFARIAGALERVGLAHRADERVKTYSMGMRQRLGIARCLLADPELLILDEPMNGLDPAGILEFRDLIRALVARGPDGVPVVAPARRGREDVRSGRDRRPRRDRHAGPLAELAGRRQAARADRRRRHRRGARDARRASRASASSRSENGVIQASSPIPTSIPELNRRLVEAGIAVRRLEPVRASLEERFLAITSRLEDEE